MIDNQSTAIREVLLYPDGRLVVESRRQRGDQMPEARQALVRILAGTVSTGTETTQIRQFRASPRPAEWGAMPLGYSASGIVEAAGPDYKGPSVGTRVAVYGGPYVRHADECIVGQNLIAPAPTLASEEASFGGVGAIALHAIRLAHIKLGQRVGILGLGVIGQLAAQLARTAGAWVIASDPLSTRQKIAQKLGADHTCSPDDWSEAVKQFTGGRGLDSILVCAGTPDNNGPAITGLEAVRFRGKVIIVGNVRTDWPRELLFQKEATVQVSRAAGPGRYDSEYERESQDMPSDLVPWTEGRNLGCFIELLAAGRVRVGPLITEVVPVEQAAAVYDRLIEQPADTMAFVLQFGERNKNAKGV